VDDERYGEAVARLETCGAAFDRDVGLPILLRLRIAQVLGVPMAQAGRLHANTRRPTAGTAARCTQTPPRRSGRSRWSGHH
jgi:hypothetical protein